MSILHTIIVHLVKVIAYACPPPPPPPVLCTCLPAAYIANLHTTVFLIMNLAWLAFVKVSVMHMLLNAAIRQDVVVHDTIM